MHDMVDRDFLSTFPLGASRHREAPPLYYKQRNEKEDSYVIKLYIISVKVHTPDFTNTLARPKVFKYVCLCFFRFFFLSSSSFNFFSTL